MPHAKHPPRRTVLISKPNKKKNFARRYRERINDRIRAPKVRVVDGATNRQIGIMVTSEALKVARARGVDLVEVAGDVSPPVCRLVDYGKFKYDQKKKEKEHPKRTNKIKEVKFRVGIDPHDYEIKMTRAEHFLGHGDKLRVQLMFRGRQMAHQEIGMDLMEKVKHDLATMAHVDMEPRKAGRNITMMLSPLPEHQRKRKFVKLNAADFEGREDEEGHHDDDALEHPDEDDDEEGAEASGGDSAAESDGDAARQA